MAAVPALATEATFERNLKVNGRVELSVVHRVGQHSLDPRLGQYDSHLWQGEISWGAGNNDQRVKEIANNPPIDQTGNIVRIGARHENYHNISIDYDIEAPSNAFLEANSGSGDVTDDGVGENSKLSTGSGNIRATGLQSGFIANTGSGDIYIEQADKGM